MQKKFLRTLFVPGLFVLAITIPQPSLSMDDYEEREMLYNQYISCKKCHGTGLSWSKPKGQPKDHSITATCMDCWSQFTERQIKLIFMEEDYKTGSRSNGYCKTFGIPYEGFRPLPKRK